MGRRVKAAAVSIQGKRIWKSPIRIPRAYDTLPEHVYGTTATNVGSSRAFRSDDVRARTSLPALHHAHQAMWSRADPARQYGAGCPANGREWSLNVRRNGCRTVTRVDRFQMRGPWIGPPSVLPRRSSIPGPIGPSGLYVPISQDDRYFFCSLVSLSMATPLVSSLSRATCLSISKGTP